MAGKSAEQQKAESANSEEWKPEDSSLTPDELKKLAKDDATKGQVVDKSQLSDPKMVAMYDTYVREKGKPPTNEWLYSWTSSWKSDKVDYVKYAEADLRGLVQHQRSPVNQKKYDKETNGGQNPGAYTGKWQEYSIWTPDAVAHVGGKVDLSWLPEGGVALLPKGSFSGGNFKTSKISGDAGKQFELAYGSQYVQAYGVPEDKGGLVGTVFGKDVAADISKALPDQVEAYVDLMTLGGTGLYLGRGSQEDAARGWESVGLKDAKRYYEPVKRVAVVTVGSVLGGPAGAAAGSAIYDASNAMSKEMQGYEVNWGDEALNASINAATTYATASLGEWAKGYSQTAATAQGTDAAAPTARAAAGANAVRAVGTAGIYGAGTYLKPKEYGGGDWRSAITASGTSLVSSAVGGPASVQAGTTFALAYATAPKEDRWRAAIAATGTSAITSGGFSSQPFGGSFRGLVTGGAPTKQDLQVTQQSRVGLNSPVPDRELYREKQPWE